MNTELLNALSIDETQPLPQICSELEERQFEYLERLETVNDEGRKKELSEVLQQIDSEIATIKSNLAALESAIILEDNSAKEEKKTFFQAKPKEKTQKEQLKKTSDYQQQIEEMQRKQAEKQKKAEEQKKKAEAQAANQNAPAVDTNPAPANQNSSASNASSELTAALRKYKSGYYNAAFDDFKELAEENDATAQYMIAIMYKNGQGCNLSEERYEFWLKKAADGGDATSQAEYAKLKFDKYTESSDSAFLYEAVRYMELAANQGDKTAMEKYADIAVQSNLADKEWINNAIGYCQKLKSECTDSFDANKYVERETELKKKLKKIRTNRFAYEPGSISYFIGSVLQIAAAVLWMIGLHKFLQDQYYFASAINEFAHKTRFVSFFSSTDYSKATLLYSFEVMFFSSVFMNIADKEMMNDFLRLFHTASTIATIACLFGNGFLARMEGKPFFFEFWEIVLVALVIKLLGWVVGSIIGHIFGAK